MSRSNRVLRPVVAEPHNGRRPTSLLRKRRPADDSTTHLLSSDANVTSIYYPAGNPAPESSTGRFRPQHSSEAVQEEELDPASGTDGAALQFVPAFVEEHKTERPERTVEPKQPEPKQEQQPRGRRISRLTAQLFPSRSPASPAPSGASSGYVGWPGTQDARGKTVSVQSYETSSNGGPSGSGGLWDDDNSSAKSATKSERPASMSALSYSNSCLRPHRRWKSAGCVTPAPERTAANSIESSSATSSAYMNEQEMVHIGITAAQLAANDQKQEPPFQHFTNLYRKEVPSLMDNADSDSSVSRRESDVFDGVSSKDSDVFDNLSQRKPSYPHSIAEEEADDEHANSFNLVLLGGGLTAIQPSDFEYSNRQTASDYDDNLTNSEVDNHGFVRLPDFDKMRSSGKSHDNSLRGIQGNFAATVSPAASSRQVAPNRTVSSDEASSLFTDPYDQDASSYFIDLSEYYVPPQAMKQVLRRYRRMTERINCDMSLTEFEREEDHHKAFALFEMRSRIMEKDIERGLERRGGTFVTDDLVTTPYFRKSQRIRDACIVSKAWRDGVSPEDVMNAAQLTQRDVHQSYWIRRPARNGETGDSVSVVSGGARRYYTWEKVGWVDDTDFMQYKCPSLGPRNMRGFDMFTVGDCQSILLKLTNEHCMNLRDELNEATRHQIEAEDMMHQEGDNGAGEETMTFAEMRYLEAMEQVKTVSKKLVIAEQSFSLVRDRIQELVNRYQALLVKIDESESMAGASSVITYESSFYSDNDSAYWEEQNNLERSRWARRAKRAEVRAELAAREAAMAKQEARMIQEQKQREVEALQQKLVELQSDPSTSAGDRERSVALTRNYAMHRNDESHMQPGDTSQTRSGINRERLDGVKQRFRDRIAAKKKAATVPPKSAPRTPSPVKQNFNEVSPSPSPNTRSLFRSAGEEMYQHLDFYERSLKAVEENRVPM